jgi:hypothetical protein
VAPVDECVFGDDIVTSSIISIPLTSVQMKCSDVFDLIEFYNKSISGYCHQEFFRSSCCQSCISIKLISIKSKSFNLSLLNLI